MGSTGSKSVVVEDSGTSNNARDRSNKVCIDCQKDKQVAHPGIDAASGESSTDRQNPCVELYKKVDTCMKSNQGQISSCVNEWKLFNECFTRHKDELQRTIQ